MNAGKNEAVDKLLKNGNLSKNERGKYFPDVQCTKKDIQIPFKFSDLYDDNPTITYGMKRLFEFIFCKTDMKF